MCWSLRGTRRARGGHGPLRSRCRGHQGRESRRRGYAQPAPLVNGQSIYFGVYNRGKKSVCLNMRREEGMPIFCDLVKTADIVLENFRPGTMAKMGLDYEGLRDVDPDIILISASAFGQYGPYRERPGSTDRSGDERPDDAHRSASGQPLGTASSIVDRYTALHPTIGAWGVAAPRPDRRGPDDRCLPDGLGADDGRDPHQLLPEHRPGGRRGGPGATRRRTAGSSSPRPPHMAKTCWR